MLVQTALQAEELTSAVKSNLAVAWKDCVAKHATVDTLSALSFATGSATTLTDYGIAKGAPVPNG